MTRMSLLKVKCDHRSKFFQFKQLESRSLKKIRAFFQASTFQLLKLEKFTAMITLHFHLIPQYKYELFHIYFQMSLLFTRWKHKWSGNCDNEKPQPDSGRDT